MSDCAGRDDPRTAADLPQDRAYEQSTLGFEWLLPRALATGTTGQSILAVTLTCAVFVRTLPTVAEVLRHARWLRPDRQRQGAQGGRLGARQGKGEGEAPEQGPPRHTEIVPVWTRVDLPALTAMIDLNELLRAKHVERSLAEQLGAAWRAWRHEHGGDLYPRTGRILLPESDCISQERYARWRETIRPDTNTLEAVAWCPVIDVRCAPVATHPDVVRASLRVINRTAPPTRTQIDYLDPNLYAARVHARMPRTAQRPMELADLPRSYRYDRQITAVGINADVRTSSGEGNATLGAQPTQDVFVLETESMPRKRVDRLEPREIKGAEPTFEVLQHDATPVLRRILDEMRTYHATSWAAKIATLPEGDLAEATGDREHFRTQEIEAFARGITLLDDPDYPWVRQAFVWMNEAMAGLAKHAYDRWHLFQIIFIVIQLPRLAARHFPELGREGDDAVDILWFAAGGGKTEAFLGLLVWQIFFDRLRAKSFGTTAMVRFPLRLLAFQQLQRMARVLAQAEVIRVRERLLGPRFSLGYFVGDNTRPNQIGDDRHARYRSRLPEKELRSLMRCPFCRSAIELRYDEELRLVEHLCTQRGSTCPGGPDRLPIYITDADIYQFLPTVIVSTVDKLALIGQNQRFANLFGRFDLVCGRHGASFRGTGDPYRKCDAAIAYAKNPTDLSTHLHTCGGKKVYYEFQDPGPALLIQDELHLLSEEMGTFDAHYETAALEMMRSLGARPWKIVAATATIERFEQHVEHLYLKQARQFPCPGPGAYDSFYYRLNPESIGRIFVGVLGVGRKHTPAVTRLTSLLYQELQVARDRAAENLAEACARYGLPQLSAPEFAELVFRYELVLTYVLTRKGSDQVAEAIRSRVCRELGELSPDHGELVLQMFNGDVDTPTMLAAMEEIELAQADTSTPAERIRGVVATNIISHGVDINRFNIIVFAGFTRLVAEYIQASARVGRAVPGISFLVVTPQSERDRSIFQRFAKFHEYLDRMVDPSAINRWPAQALERTVAGVLSGYLMGVAANQMGRRIASVQDFQHLLGGRGAEPLSEDAVLAWVTRALGANSAPYPEYRRDLELVVRKRYAQLANSPLHQGQYDYFNIFLNAMRSLRDIDDPAEIAVVPKGRDMLRNLLRA